MNELVTTIANVTLPTGFVSIGIPTGIKPPENCVVPSTLIMWIDGPNDITYKLELSEEKALKHD